MPSACIRIPSLSHESLAMKLVVGNLSTYGAPRLGPIYRAATYVDRILRCDKPADPPVQAPTRADHQPEDGAEFPRHNARSWPRCIRFGESVIACATRRRKCASPAFMPWGRALLSSPPPFISAFSALLEPAGGPSKLDRRDVGELANACPQHQSIPWQVGALGCEPLEAAAWSLTRASVYVGYL
jgi:hypothetical protein